MHVIQQGLDNPGQSSVPFLPMTDLYSGDKTCILSTLNFMCDLNCHQTPCSANYYIRSATLLESLEIITDAPEGGHLKTVVLMLGCCHTFIGLNLIGAIDTFNLTDGTRLTGINEFVYDQNAVHHMMRGQSAQKAFHGHPLGWTDVSITALCQIYLRIIQSLGR